MITLKDISKASGFSVTTVSKALNGYTDVNEETRKTILRISKNLGYVPNLQARSLVMKKTWTIGIVIDEISGIGLQHPLFAEVLEAFKNTCEKSGYDIMILSLQVGAFKMDSYLDHARQKAVDGVFIIVTDFDNHQYKDLSESEIPCVVFDHISANIINVTTNNKKGIELAFDHLHELGHRKIAHIYGSSITLAGQQRMNSYINKLNENKLELCGEYLVDGDAFTFDGGYNAMKRLIKLDDKPTGIICASDLQALGAIRAIFDGGFKCPRDFSVVGFDGTITNQYSTPRITTVKQPTKELGEMAAVNLIKLINKEIVSEPKTIIAEPSFIIGESTRIL